MAEVLARSISDDRSLDFASGGISAKEESPASEAAHAVMARRGLDLSAHRARNVSAPMLDGANLVLAMEKKHRDELLRFPSFGDKVLLLSEWAGESAPGPGVDDPFGKAESEYEITASQLALLIEAGLKRR
jgi:protein-tyrosine-phosphatase